MGKASRNAGLYSRRRFIRNTAGAGATLAALPLMSCTKGTSVSDAAWPNLSALAERYIAQGKVANMLAVVSQNRKDPVVIGGGMDRMNGERPSDIHSLYRIYSMTKPIVGMAAMMLISEGRLALDQPLADISPRFANMQVQIEYDGPITPDNLEPADRPITIRHMLTHTSGLGYSFVQQGPLSAAMKEVGAVTGLVGPNPPPELARGTPVTSLAKFADLMSTMPLTHQPGTQWSYSTGLDVMGRVIEAISGQPFDEFLDERIFRPCAMDSTFFRVPTSARERLTDNYDVRSGELVLLDPGANSVFSGHDFFPMGGTGLVTSPHDYDRFLRMLGNTGKIDGTRVLPEAAVRMGTSDLLPDPSVTQGSFVEGYRFGAAGRLGWAGLENAYGWAGSAGTYGFVDMDSGLRAGLYTQYLPASHYPLSAEFEAAVASDLAFQLA